jgi:hypothetical protein
MRPPQARKKSVSSPVFTNDGLRGFLYECIISVALLRVIF